MGLLCAFSVAAELRQSWLGGGSQVTLGALENLEKKINEDPENQSVLAQAEAKVGAHSMNEFSKVITICGKDVPESVQGLTSSQRTSYPIFRSDDSIMEGKTPEESYRAEIEKFKSDEGAVSAREVITPGYAFVAVQNGLSICLRQDLTFDDAVLTLIHELTHFVQLDPTNEADILSFKDENEYLMNRVLVPGGEVDAFMTQFRAQIRQEKSRSNIPRKIKDSFNDQGAFLGTREAVAQFVLLSEYQGGMGYANHSYRGEYAGQLKQTYLSEVTLRNEFASAINLGNSNLAIFVGNQGIYRHNLSVYQSWIDQGVKKKNADLEAKGRKNLAKAQNQIEVIEAYLPVKREILAGYKQELVRRDVRIKAFETKLGILREAPIEERQDESQNEPPNDLGEDPTVD